MKPKTKKVLEYLQAGYRLTSLEAVRLGLGIDFRKRVSELRALGYQIGSMWEYANGCNFKRYFLEK